MAATSQTFEERFEQLMKLNVEKDAQLDYLIRQLDQAMRNNQKEIQSSRFSIESKALEEGAEEEDSDSSVKKKRPIRASVPSKQAWVSK